MRSSTSPSALKIRTGSLRPVARSDCTRASPSSFGSIRSTMARSTGDRGGEVQTRHAVRRDIHRMARLAQGLRQIVPRNFVIFDNQNVHGLISYRR